MKTEETESATTATTTATTTPTPTPATTSSPSSTPTPTPTKSEEKADVTITEDDDDSGPPPLEDKKPTQAEQAGQAGQEQQQQPAEEDEEKGKGKQSKNEKKSRKALQKLGLKPVPGIQRVTVKKSKTILFVISKPDVFKSPGSDTYVIFGEAKIEDLSTAPLTKKAEQLLESEGNNAEGATPGVAATPVTDEAQTKQKKAGKTPDAAPTTTAPPPEPEDLDETGIESKDIDLVMEQVNVSRAQAIRALRAHNGDIVNAVMALST